MHFGLFVFRLHNYSKYSIYNPLPNSIFNKVFICVFDLWCSYIRVIIRSSFLPWLSTVGFDSLALPFSLISSAKSQPVHLPTPFSVSSPLLSFQHHFDTDESPIFTCIFHFPYVAGYRLLCLLFKHTILMSKSVY